MRKDILLHRYALHVPARHHGNQNKPGIFQFLRASSLLPISEDGLIRWIHQSFSSARRESFFIIIYHYHSANEYPFSILSNFLLYFYLKCFRLLQMER